MSEYERKMKHLKRLKKTAVAIERRISEIEIELQREMKKQYAVINSK